MKEIKQRIERLEKRGEFGEPIDVVIHWADVPPKPPGVPPATATYTDAQGNTTVVNLDEKKVPRYSDGRDLMR